MVVYQEKYDNVRFLHDKSYIFISWICPLLKPFSFRERQYLFLEGDEVTHMSFLVSGKAGFVLPKYDNAKYININVGDHFGFIDVISSIKEHDLDKEDWISSRNLIKREFTIIAETETEVLNLNITDVHKMKIEFYDCYEKLFDASSRVIARAIMCKLKAVSCCR